MITETPSQATSPATSPVLEARILSHRAHLGSKYAFLFNQETINKVKTNAFPQPLRREVGEELDTKLEAEVSTSASSADSLETRSRQSRPVFCPLFSPPASLRVAVDDHSLCADRLQNQLAAFEDFLLASRLASSETVAKARELHRRCLERLRELGYKSAVGHAAETFFAVVVFSCERLGVDPVAANKFAESEVGLRRVNKLDRIRKVRAYTTLNNFYKQAVQLSGAHSASI